MGDGIQRLRWTLADWLSFAACKLRGHEWYVADTFHGVPGNRAAELKQQIWIEIVGPGYYNKIDGMVLDQIENQLTELAQLAGENWGHFPRPK